MNNFCVFYCLYGNEKYLDLLRISLKSISKHVSKESIIVFSEFDLEEIKQYATLRLVNFPSGYAIPMSYRLILGEQLLDEFEQIIHLDADTIVTGDITKALDCIVDNEISFATESLKEPRQAIEGYWAGPLLTPEEKINFKGVLSICAGVFAFNRSVREHLPKAYVYVKTTEESGFKGPCLDQHAFVAYVLRHDIYNHALQDTVCHDAQNLFTNQTYDPKSLFRIYHFAGGVTTQNKPQLMNTALNHAVTKVTTRNELLDLLPKNMKIAELGVFKGDFSQVLIDKLEPTEVALVDFFPKKMCSGDKDGNNVEWVNLENIYPMLLKKYENNKQVKIIKGTTVQYLKSIPDNSLDMIYIDADHSYEAVKKDLEISLHKVRQDGYILGHDYTPRFEGVIRAVDEFCKENNLHIEMLTEDGCPTYLIRNKKSQSISKDSFVKAVKPYTMTSVERMHCLYDSLEHIRQQKIEGDYVECGVWKGGNILGILKYLKSHANLENKVWLYDTFSGMTAPDDEHDFDLKNRKASDIFEQVLCYSSLNSVKACVSQAGYPEDKIKYVIGDICNTLLVQENIPEKIALLRLDTDFYQSTKIELEVLWDKLSSGGVLIIDDYGHWKGCRKAVDEFFKGKNIKLTKIDYTGVYTYKP